MAKFIENADITHVSLVDAAANKKKFYLAKAENSIEIQVKIMKALTDGEEHIVWSPVYEPNIEDAHGDSMTAEEIEKAADKFLENLKNEDESGIDNQHSFKAEEGLLVAQSFVAQDEMEMFGETITKGTWMMKVRILDDDIWQKIESEEITGLSMGGTGEIIEKSGGEQVDKDITKEEATGIIKKLQKFFKIEKGELAEEIKFDIGLSKLRTMIWSLEDLVWEKEWSGNKEEISSLFKEYADLSMEVYRSIENSSMEDIIKSIKKNKDGERMNEAEVKEIVKNALEEEMKAVEPVVNDEVMTAEVIKNIVVEAVKPLQEANVELQKQLDESKTEIETLKKSTAGTTQIIVEKDVIIKENRPSYMKNFG